MKEKQIRVFITDCEGPVTRNDNAAELADEFIPDGHRFFAKISLYDDYLAEVARKPGYKAGDTLRLILPFFKAFGLDHETMIKFSATNIQMIPEAQRVLQEILAIAPAYMVSTSYSPYIQAVCDAIGFPFGNTFSTRVNLDSYVLSDAEKAELIKIHRAILDLPDFAIPPAAGSIEDLPEQSRGSVRALDEIFWSVLPRMEINRIVSETNPIGGREKGRAIEVIIASLGLELRDVIYVGDSITDVDAFRLVRSGGGLAVSFNGNDWAVKEASFAVMARNALPIGWLASLFISKGLEGLEDLLVSHVDSENVEKISAKSCRIRKEVRTEKIGGLG
jgi:predicted HAD superfamily phosphohydrolase